MTIVSQSFFPRCFYKDLCYPHKNQSSTKDRIYPQVTDRNMGSHTLRPAIDYTQSHVSPSYAQPRNIPSTSITLTCPARTHTRYQYHLHMPSHKLYLVPFFTLISPAEERTQFKIACSRCHAHVHKLMVHLRFIHDVDIHPHHLHVHSTRPFTTTGCSPCFPPPFRYFG